MPPPLRHTISRDDNDKDKYTHKDKYKNKYKDKVARNSNVSVLMCIGCNAICLMTFVHLKTKKRAQTKTKTKCSKDPTYAIFHSPHPTDGPSL